MRCLGAAAACAGASVAADAAAGQGRACIFLWLGGGAAQIDTFDPKRRGDGKKKPGSYYDAIPTAVAGESGLRAPRRGWPTGSTAACSSARCTTRSSTSTPRRPTCSTPGGRRAGRSIYPSIGSIVAHERGPAGDGVPAYVVIGYPNVSRGPGFLGSKYGYVYLTDTEAGPTGLTPPADVTPDRRDRARGAARSRSARTSRPATRATPPSRDYDAGQRARRPGSPARPSRRVFQLDREPAAPPRVVRRRVRPALPAGPAAGRGGRAVRRGLAQPQLPQRHRLGHPQPGPAPASTS